MTDSFFSLTNLIITQPISLRRGETSIYPGTFMRSALLALQITQAATPRLSLVMDGAALLGTVNIGSNADS